MNAAAAAPAAVLALVAAALPPRSLTCLMAASAAVVAALRPASESAVAGLAVWPLVAALALGLASSALQEAVETSGSPSGFGAAWTAAVAGAVCVLTLIAVDGARILRWRFGLGAGATRLELPGAALVLGLALLVSLAGSLATAAHLLARAPEGFRAGRIGQSLMVLGAGLGALGVAVAAGQGFSRRAEALSASARELAAMVLAVGVLAWALVRLIAPTAAEAVDEGASPRRWKILRLAAAAAMLAAAAAGAEGWRAEGTYATATLAATSSAALLGLVAVQPTRLALPRTALFVLGLLAALARAL
jgi:hypothetical protein